MVGSELIGAPAGAKTTIAELDDLEVAVFWVISGYTIPGGCSVDITLGVTPPRLRVDGCPVCVPGLRGAKPSRLPNVGALLGIGP